MNCKYEMITNKGKVLSNKKRWIHETQRIRELVMHNVRLWRHDLISLLSEEFDEDPNNYCSFQIKIK